MTKLHFLLKFHVELHKRINPQAAYPVRLPQNTLHSNSKLTSARGISPSSLSSQSEPPDMLLDQDLLAQILLIVLSICSFSEAAPPQEHQYFVCNQKFCWPRPTARRRQAPSHPLRRILFWCQSSTGSCRPSWSCPNLLFSTCFLSSVLFFWQGLFVVIHLRTCP